MNLNDLNDSDAQVNPDDGRRHEEDVRLHELGYDRKLDNLTDEDVRDILQDEDDDADNTRLSGEVPSDEQDNTQ